MSAEKGAALLEPAVGGCTALLTKMIAQEEVECEPVTFCDGASRVCITKYHHQDTFIIVGHRWLSSCSVLCS